ncbi:MAG: hypothetical protein C4346_12040 [Chloroflexota bacterium]
MSDLSTLKAAAFVAQALELEENPQDLASHVLALKRDVNAGISTIELESSVGPAAFLIYHYLLPVTDSEGRTGQALFEADLATLERAAAQDAPGPRLLAHAVAGDEAYILATTPATYRVLTGQAEPSAREASEADVLPGGETERTRREAALDVLRLLQEAEQRASSWLRAIQAEGRMQPDSNVADVIPFYEEETALALFLLDERSIGNLLRVLNLILQSAHAQAQQAVRPDDAGSR